MDTLAGYLATLASGALLTYLSQFLQPKIKINYWHSHNFLYSIPPAQLNPAPNPAPALPAAGRPVNPAPTPAAPNFLLLTQSLTVQNRGRKAAEWVEIVHGRRQDFFQLYPALQFTEAIAASGEHTLRINSLARHEHVTVQFLCYSHMPALSHVRSNAGPAKQMPWIIAPKYPQWVYILMLLAMVLGCCFSAYWIIKGAIFVLKSIGAL